MQGLEFRFMAMAEGSEAFCFSWLRFDVYSVLREPNTP